MESRRRAITKAITYRIWQSCNTFLIALFFTQNFETAAQIVSVEVFLKIIIYYWHERIWLRLDLHKIKKATDTAKMSRFFDTQKKRK